MSETGQSRPLSVTTSPRCSAVDIDALRAGFTPDATWSLRGHATADPMRATTRLCS